MVNQILNNYDTFLLMFIRMNGMILFNPIFGRRNIPAVVKMGLAFILSAMFIGTAPVSEAKIYGLPMLIFAGISELAIGFGLGTIMNMFISAFLMGAEIIDVQLGIGMARFYDPTSNVSMPVTGSLFNTVTILFFFATKGHLSFIRIIGQSFQILPVGFNWNWDQAAISTVGLFMSVLTLALKLAMPVIAIEFIFEICLGIMMRAVPQINVFTLGVQLKLFIGLLVLIVLAPALGSLLDSLYNEMYSSMSFFMHSLAKN